MSNIPKDIVIESLGNGIDFCEGEFCQQALEHLTVVTQ